MALLKVEAEKLSKNILVAGVIEEIITRDELFALLPWTGIVGKAYVYNRENVLATVDFLDPNDAVNEGASSFTEVISKLRILIGDVDVDKFLQETMADTNNQEATQIGLKAKALRRRFQDCFVNGDNTGSPKEFDGVKNLTTGGQTITAGANGAALTLAMIDELIDAIPYGPDLLMMRSGTIRAYRALLRATGGTDAAMVMIQDFGMVLGHNGVPIVRNDFLPGAEVQGSSSVTGSVYAMRLNELDGLHGIYGGSNAGLVVENVGTVQNKDANRTRLKWYCGLALKSTKSLARLKGLTSI